MKTRVAIVDDESGVRSVLALYINRTPDMEVVGDFGTAKEALAHLVGLTPDAVLVDVLLPDLSGIQLVGLLKARLPGVKLIILTGLPSEEADVLARKAGADWVLHKPLTTSAFVDDVRKVMAGRLSLHKKPSTAYAEAMALAEAGLAIPRRLTGRVFQLWQELKGVPGGPIAKAEEAGYSASKFKVLLGLSRWQSTRLWRHCFGLSLGEWLHCVRMIQAACRLRQGMSSHEVAKALKYSRTDDLTKAIRQFFGKSVRALIRETEKEFRAHAPKCRVGRPKLPCSEKDVKAPGNRSGMKGANPRISTQEEDILELVAKGSLNKEIAEALKLSENTIKYYLKRICRKTGTHGRAEVTAWYLRHKANSK